MAKVTAIDLPMGIGKERKKDLEKDLTMGTMKETKTEKETQRETAMVNLMDLMMERARGSSSETSLAKVRRMAIVTAIMTDSEKEKVMG